jgi:phage baseplate assembly protein W
MFSTNHTNVWNSDEFLAATKQNTKLVLLTNKGEIFGDPYFGLLLKQYMFDQNSYVLRDILIDMIYNQLAIFIPQVRIKRQDISIIQDTQKGTLVCTFSGVSQIDYTINTFELVLFDENT